MKSLIIVVGILLLSAIPNYVHAKASIETNARLDDDAVHFKISGYDADLIFTTGRSNVQVALRVESLREPLDKEEAGPRPIFYSQVSISIFDTHRTQIKCDKEKGWEAFIGTTVGIGTWTGFYNLPVVDRSKLHHAVITWRGDTVRIPLDKLKKWK